MSGVKEYRSPQCGQIVYRSPVFFMNGTASIVAVCMVRFICAVNGCLHFGQIAPPMAKSVTVDCRMVPTRMEFPPLISSC